METILKDIYEVLLTRKFKDSQKVELATAKLETALLKGEEEEKRAALEWFSDVQTVDLGTANTNKLIWNRPAKGLFILSATGGADFRFGGTARASYPVQIGYIKRDFEKIYLTNTSQSGMNFKFVVSNFAEADYRMLASGKATIPFIYKVTMTNADAEYMLHLLPLHTKKFTLLCQDGTLFRFAFKTGQVATSLDCIHVLANSQHKEENLDLITHRDIYVACGEAGKVAKVLCWT